MNERLTKIPALKDVHVHSRVGMEHKETPDTLARSAIFGGYDTLWLMPNDMPVVDKESVEVKIQKFKNTPINYSVFVGATMENFNEHKMVSKKVCGLKIYMNETTGDLLIEDQETLRKHFENWPKGKPIFVHAEMETLDVAINLSEKYGQHLHVCHVSRAFEVELIKKAKESGLNVTCEVSPHHLFLTKDDEKILGVFAKMKPTLGSRKDNHALWKAVRSGIIDMIATDHAPHTREEKLSSNPPYGVPGLETTLPLLLTAVAQKRLNLEEVVKLTSTNPENIFGLHSGNYVLVDLDQKWVVPTSGFQTKCDWSPFSGMNVQGKIRKIVIRGKEITLDEMG